MRRIINLKKTYVMQTLKLFLYQFFNIKLLFQVLLIVQT